MTLRRAAVLVAACALAALAPAPRAVAGDDAPKPAAAPAAPAVDLASPAAAAWMREDWYGVFCGESRVGWMRRSLARADFGGVPCVVREVEVHIDVAGDGNEVVNATRTVCRAEGDQALVAAWSERRENGKRTAREIVRKDKRFDVVTERRGERVEGAVAATDVALADELGIERVVAEAAGAASPDARPSLVVASIDLGTLVAGERRMTVASVAGAGADRVFTVDVEVAADASQRPGTRPAKDSVQVDATGAVVAGSLGPRFSYRREDEVVAKHAASRKSLEALSRIPLEAKPGERIGATAAVRKLTVAWDQAKARAFVSNPRQRVRIDGTSVLVEIARDDDAEPNVVPADETSQRDALADEPGLGVVDPLVGKAATLLLAGTSNRGDQVARILAFTSERITKEVVLGTPSTMEILQNLRGDCTEHAQAFVALCRVAGIPARTVDGLSWLGDEAGAFGWHQWAEVALGGKWLAVDPTTGANPAPATNIAVDATPEIRTLLWGAKLRLVAVEREDRKPPRETVPKGLPDPAGGK